MNIRLRYCPHCKALLDTPGRVYAALHRVNAPLHQRDLASLAQVSSIRQLQSCLYLLRDAGLVEWIVERGGGRARTTFILTEDKAHQRKVRAWMSIL